MAAWHIVVGASTLVVLSLISGYSGDRVLSSNDTAAINPNDLNVIDCLLPGQVRQIGQARYLSARRAIKTTEHDCAIRGGEYVAYDRADYQSALAVWLPLASEGDAVAQNYVGEIYEKGLGADKNYQQAAFWYQKAADNDNARSMMN